MSPTILYLNCDSGAERTRRKLAGIRRFAKMHGWSVRTPVLPQSGTSSMRALLAQSHPIGCIVECTGGGAIPPPARFGNVPVVYLDPSTPPKWCGANFVCCDNAAVGRLAFEELSAGLPPCCAAVPCVSRLPWSDVRIAAFRERCEEARLPCHVFDGKRNEDSDGRIGRLADWIAALPRFCAVFAVNDFSAGDVAVAARRVHRHIPKELTLVGVDGMPDGAVDASPPGASSIQLDFELAGYLAAKMLGTVIAAKSAKDESNVRFATNSFGPCAFCAGNRHAGVVGASLAYSRQSRSSAPRRRAGSPPRNWPRGSRAVASTSNGASARRWATPFSTKSSTFAWSRHGRCSPRRKCPSPPSPTSAASERTANFAGCSASAPAPPCASGAPSEGGSRFICSKISASQKGARL